MNAKKTPKLETIESAWSNKARDAQHSGLKAGRVVKDKLGTATMAVVGVASIAGNAVTGFAKGLWS